LEEHISRFLRTFQLDKKKEAQNRQQLIHQLRELIQCNNISDGNIRFQFNNNQLNRFCAWFIPSKYPTYHQYSNGIDVKTYHGERIDPNIKSRDIELRLAVDRFITREKVYEAILLNPKSELTEGSRSNIFFVTDECIVTPPLELVLPGITRQHIIFLIKKHGIQFEERNIHIDEIANFASCFISGTSPKILPVKKFDELLLDIKNPLVQKLMKLYDQSIGSYLSDFKWR
jgi:branched-chain amino acid aminotransferase